MNPEYYKQLKELSHLLCPIKEVVEIEQLVIPYKPQNRWDSEGTYLEREIWGLETFYFISY